MNQFAAALQRFGIGRLAAILGIAAGVTAALVALTMNLGEPKALLYSNLDLKEASSITQALDQAGIKYEVKGDGSSILVGRDEVASTRLMLSGKGLPTSGSVGYELFDEANALGQTDFVQQLNQQRALEGELARTIRSLDGVTFTRVHLVLPKRQLFEDTVEPPQASVTLGIGGREPSAEQVRAIQNLVAGAVPNLKPDQVTIVDQHAKTLSGESGADAAADSRKNETEQRIAKTVRALVEGVVGPGKARVNVTADLDLAQVTTQQETFDPDGQVIRSEQTVEENAKDGQGTGDGTTSVSANIPGGQSDQTSMSGGSASGRTESTTNYEISKTTRTEVKGPGAIKRLSVAVAVDGVTATGAGGKPGAYTPRSAEEMQRIEQLVRTAVGFDTDRGDQVTVVNVRFPTLDAGAGAGVTAANPLMGFDKNDIMRAGELGVLAIVAILMLFFIVRPLVKNATGPGSPVAMGFAGQQRTGSPDFIHAQMMDSPEQLALTGNPDLDQKIDIARIEGQVKASSVKRVAEFVERHPDESVSILRTWLHETS